jgi:phage terminase small subunit
MLTNKKRRFIEYYLQSWNATRAAKEAGYAFPDRQASRILKDADVVAAVKERMQEVAMETDEILARLSQQARADISQYLLSNGEPNWEAIRRAGHLVKRVAKNRNGWVVELHDAQSALALMAKARGLMVERVQQNQSQVNIYLPKKDENGNG